MKTRGAKRQAVVKKKAVAKKQAVVKKKAVAKKHAVVKKKAVAKKQAVVKKSSKVKAPYIPIKDDEDIADIVHDEVIDDTPEHINNKSSPSVKITPKKNKISETSKDTSIDIMMSADKHPDDSQYNEETFIQSSVAVGRDVIFADDGVTAVQVADELICTCKLMTNSNEKVLFLINMLNAFGGCKYSAELRINDCFGRALFELTSVLDGNNILVETLQQTLFRLEKMVYYDRGFHNKDSGMVEISLGLNELEHFEVAIQILREKLNQEVSVEIR